MKLLLTAFLPLVATGFTITTRTTKTVPSSGVLLSGASSSNLVSRSRCALYAEIRPDTSEMVKAAMDASSKFGPTSKEARLAWEAVEEMDSSTRTADAMALGSSLDECDIDGATADCIEYGAKLSELEDLIKDTAPVMDRVKNVAMEIKAIKMAFVDMPKGADSPMIRKALKAAKAATAEFGVESSESKLAWEELEEIASANEKAQAMGGRLDEECLTEMIEACEALEELQNVLNLAKADGRYGG